MGKGTIISGGTDGQYQLQVNYDRTNYDNTISILNDNIAKLEAKLAGLDPIDDKDEYNITNLQKTAIELKKTALESAMPEDETISAWCADFTEDLSGEVGTIEVPGESVEFNIQAGHGGNSLYDTARDGQLSPTITQTAAQAFYNLAMLPGWQKWMPTYRYATINSIDFATDTASITLESATSTQQGLNVNQETSFSDVPIEYMQCNAAAFEAGDDVLVKFVGQDKDNPKIIGFKDNPKPCSGFFIQPKFNGNLADYGQMTIKISYTTPNGDVSFTKTIASADSDLKTYTASPIIFDDMLISDIDIYDVKVELKALWGNEYLSWGAMDIRARTFSHWELCEQSDPAAQALDIRKTYDDAQVLVYAKRVEWKEAVNYLADCETSTLTYEGVEYPVYIVEFNNLKVIARTPTTIGTHETIGTNDPEVESYPQWDHYADFAGCNTSWLGIDYDPWQEILYYDNISLETNAHALPDLKDDFQHDYADYYCLYVFWENDESTTYQEESSYALTLVGGESNEPINITGSTRIINSDKEYHICDPCPEGECLEPWYTPGGWYDYDGGLYRMTWVFSTVDTPSDWW